MDARRYGISLRVFNSISRYKAEHEKRNSISTSNHVLVCLLYKHTNNDVFDDFPKISEDLRKLSEGHTNVSEHFRRLPTKIRRCFDQTPTNLVQLKPQTWYQSLCQRYHRSEIIVILDVQLRLFSGLKIYVKHRSLYNKII
jgi:hypothetical protein